MDQAYLPWPEEKEKKTSGGFGVLNPQSGDAVIFLKAQIIVGRENQKI